MAIRKDASGDTISRTTNLPTITSFTIMGWFKLSVDRNTYSALLSFGTNSSSPYYSILTDGSGTDLYVYNSSGLTTTGTSLTVGTWVHAALTVAGTGAGQVAFIRNGVATSTHAGSATPTAGIIVIGSTPSDNDWLNGCVAAVKIYSAVLTAAEIAKEMQQYLPVRTANLNGFYPMLSTSDDEVDFSGNGNNWTIGGTLATEDGPPIPWKTGRKRVITPASVAAPFTWQPLTYPEYRRPAKTPVVAY